MTRVLACGQSISLTLPCNACACLWCHAVLHLDANAAQYSSPHIDLSSTIIPVDDEEEEEEETYDDIEGVTGLHLPHLRAAPRAGAADEEDEDIYEVLPGTRMWLLRMQRHPTHTRTHKLSCYSDKHGRARTHTSAFWDFCSKKHL